MIHRLHLLSKDNNSYKMSSDLIIIIYRLNFSGPMILFAGLVVVVLIIYAIYRLTLADCG